MDGKYVTSRLLNSNKDKYVNEIYVSRVFFLLNMFSQATTKYRNILWLVTETRRISLTTIEFVSSTLFYCTCRIYVYTKTIVAGCDCIILNYFGKECDMHAFSNNHDVIENIPDS